MSWDMIWRVSLAIGGGLGLFAFVYFVLSGRDPWISLIAAGVLAVMSFLVSTVALALLYPKRD